MLIFVIAVFNIVVSAGAFVDSVLVACRRESLRLFSHTLVFGCGIMSAFLVRFGAEEMDLAVSSVTLVKFAIRSEIKFALRWVPQ